MHWLKTLVVATAAALCSAASAADASWDGMWMGRATGGQMPLDVVIDVQGGDAPSVKVTLIAGGIMQQPFKNVVVNADQVKASWDMGGTGVIAVDLKHSGTNSESAEGTLHMEPPGTKTGIDQALTLTRKRRAETVEGAQHWVSKIDVPNGELQLGLILATLPNGSAVGAFSVPAQGLQALPIYVERSGPAWNLTIPVPGSARLLLAPVEDRLEGRFQQGTTDEAVVFTRGEAVAVAPKVKPQTPKGPFPYKESPVTVSHKSGHVLAGTLTMPDGASPTAKVPGIVLATGSGAQDRNETLLGHQPFLVLADALARAGIAVLRVDDRGVGESTGSAETATSLDLATDVDAAFEFLKTQPGVDPARVGILGHSEGAILAAITAANATTDHRANPPAFIVFMAGPGVPGGQVLKVQNEAILRAHGMPAEAMAKQVTAHKALIDAAVSGTDDAGLLPLARALVVLQIEQARAEGRQIPPGVEESVARQAVAQMRSPWMKTFLTLDPAESIRKIKVPVLALNGTLDTQVIPSQNLPAIRAALANSGSTLTVKEYPGLNHLFQPCKTGALEEYATIDITIDPAVLQDITQWIREKNGMKAAPTPPAKTP